MGYPIEMIDKQTALYSLIGESAIESKKDDLFNDLFKQQDVNAKIMPLNIRMDDIGFFLHGFKDSQIKAGYFQREFWKILHSLLEDMSEEAKICGIIDTIDVKDGKNDAYLMQGRACVSLIEPKGKKVAIYGDSPSVKSILYHLRTSGVKEVVLYSEVVEDCMPLMEILPEVDVLRVIDKQIDAKDVDIFIDGVGDCEVQTSAKVLDLTKEKASDDKLSFYDIEKEIAKIKTKEWIENG